MHSMTDPATPAPTVEYRSARRPMVGLRVREAHSLALALLLAMAPALAAQTPEAAPADGAPIEAAPSLTLNFNDADIRAFIAAVADLTKRNFVVDPRVQGRVTVISAAPTDPDELFEVFLSILRVHGFTAITSGSVTKIVPESTARQEAPSDPGASRQDLVTAVIPVYYVAAAELVPLLRPLLPQEAHLAATPTTNVLVAADVKANIDRLLRIVREVDVQPTQDVDVITLKHAAAEDLVRTLDALAAKSQPQPGDPQQLSFIADQRTNSILLSGPQQRKLRFRALIAHLDSPGPDSSPAQVVYLRYAAAADLATVLEGVANGQGPPAAGGRGGERAPPPALPLAAPDNQVRITADEATNALIIQGPPRDVRTLLDIVAKLDVRRAQVLVEGIVAEVSNVAVDELGVQWKTSLPKTGFVAGSLLPGVNAGGIDSPFDAEDTVGFFEGLTLGYLSGGDIRALIRALASDSYTNVLSTPSLMTLDNAEAEIVVGQNVPFITGQFTNQATTPDNPFQTIERQDVGILLKVKPQINEGNSVTLDIEQEVSSVDRSTAGADLITNKRAITTSVLVDDGDIVVLGGLISDEKRDSQQKVPLLGDIPLLGQLFRSTNSDATKTNLMVFLRPKIVRDETQNRELAHARYDDIRGKQNAQEHEQRHTLLREDGPHLIEFDGLVE